MNINKMLQIAGIEKELIKENKFKKSLILNFIHNKFPEISVKHIELIGSSALSDTERKKQDLEKYGKIRDDYDRDIDIKVYVTGITHDQIEEWAFSEEANELDELYGYDVQLELLHH